MVGRTCGLADRLLGTRRISRCPASPSHKWRLAKWGARSWTPLRIANKNAALSNDRRLSAQQFGPPSPRRSSRPTQEEYPNWARLSKVGGANVEWEPTAQCRCIRFGILTYREVGPAHICVMPFALESRFKHSLQPPSNKLRFVCLLT